METTKRFLIGIPLILLIIVAILLLWYFPLVLGSIAFIVAAYALGSLVREEITFRNKMRD